MCSLFQARANGVRAQRLILLLILLPVCLVGCLSPGSGSVHGPAYPAAYASAADSMPVSEPVSEPIRVDGTIDDGLAILGITAAQGVEAAINRNLLGLELTRQIRELRGLPVLSTPRVRQTVGADAFGRMMTHLTVEGHLARADVQRLMAARLPVSRALVLRIIDNRVVPGRTRVQAIRDAQGNRLEGGEQLIMSTRRHSRVAVELLDLATGRPVWQRIYSAAPERQQVYRRFRGTDLGSSLLAGLATVVTQGSNPEPPAAPGLQLTMHSLMRAVALDLPHSAPLSR